MKNTSRFMVLVMLIALFGVCAVAQQTTGEITGIVSDASGAVVPDATVTATNAATGFVLTAKSNGSGKYRIANVPAGRYELTANHAGFAAYTAKNVDIVLNKVNTVNIAMKTGEVTTTVEVTSAENQIDTATPQIQTTYDEKATSDNALASTGSGVLNLSLLNAGVSTSGGIGLGTGPSVGGQRPRNNNFMIEGADNNDRSVTGPLANVPNDAVQNFTVLQNQVNPEFGYSSGGQFNTIVKTGTNTIHGLAYIYNQNRNYDARDYKVPKSTDRENSRFDRNRYGGQIGGPIIKNKLFGFFNFERNSFGQAALSNTVRTPTAAGFALLDGMAGSFSANNYSIFKQYVPAATGPQVATQPVNGVPIPLGEVTFAGADFSDTNTYVTSGDWNASEGDQLHARFIRNNLQSIDTSAAIPAFWLPVPVISNVAVLSEFHTFNPSIVNEIRMSYTRNEQEFPGGNFVFPGLDQFPNLQFGGEYRDLQVGPDPNAPQGGIQNGYQIADNISWQKGRHGLKFGVEFRWNISPQNFTQRSRGDYNYHTLEEYLLDKVPTDLGERSTGDSVYYGNMKQIFWYAADQWKVTSRLTLDLGVRYEYTGVPLAEKLQALNSAASVPGLIDFREPRAQKGNIVPRIGFAYDPTGSGNTSIRGGFGMTIDKLYDNLGLLSVPPQLGGTQDVNPLDPTTSFLANGGLLPGTGGLNTFPDVLTQRQFTAAFVPDQKLPYSIQWNLGVQHTFFKDYALEVRYVGTRGIHLPVQQVINRQSKVTAANALPLYLAAPTQAELDGLTSTLASINAGSNVVPAFAAAGFDPPAGSFITAFNPLGSSIYNGLQTQLTRSFTRGLQLQAAYTWSHLIDNSTADVFSTVLNPRRPQNPQDFNAERSTSALDRRHRLSLSAIWDVPLFKGSNNWIAKNVLGNWEIAPNYTFESGQPFTVQSAQDVNRDGDSAGDRAWFFPSGVGSSDVTPLKNTGGDTVAYLAVNPNAKYIRAGLGQLPNGGRNTIIGNPINNVNMSLVKRFNFTERMRLELHAQAINLLNHPQYIAGRLADVAPLGTSAISRTILTPGNADFGLFNASTGQFSNNPRQMVLALKIIF